MNVSISKRFFPLSSRVKGRRGCRDRGADDSTGR